MFAEFVKFEMPDGFSRADALADAKSSVPAWGDNPDVLKKTVFYGEDGNCYGLYLWTSREACLKAHSPEWQEKAAKRMGVEPQFTYMDVMMILDNETGTIETFEE